MVTGKFRFEGAEYDAQKVVAYGIESSIRTIERNQQITTDSQDGRKLASSASIVTMVIQSSEERFWMLPHICRRWGGPISFAGYFHTDNLQAFSLIQKVCPLALLTPLVKQSETEIYPINKLRNIGIKAVMTPYFILIDIDFWPDGALHKSLNFYARVMKALGMEKKTALIVPAFRLIDLNSTCHWAEQCPEVYEAAIPLDFYQLNECVSHNYCRIFDWIHNSFGHSTTDYPAWLSQNRTDLRRVPCFRSNRYEPYMLLKKNDAILYDEAFTGYGKNKIALIMNLRLLNYSFYVLPRNFVTHVPHRPSKDRKSFERRDEHRDEMDKIFEGYKEKLKEASVKLRTRLCSDDGVALEVGYLIKSYQDTWYSSVLVASKTAAKIRIGKNPAQRFVYTDDIPQPPCEEEIQGKKPPECY